MTKIRLSRPWTYRTPELTIDYPAGEHEVAAAIAAAAPKEKHHGRRTAKARAPRVADQAEE